MRGTLRGHGLRVAGCPCCADGLAPPGSAAASWAHRAAAERPEEESGGQRAASRCFTPLRTDTPRRCARASWALCACGAHRELRQSWACAAWDARPAGTGSASRGVRAARTALLHQVPLRPRGRIALRRNDPRRSREGSVPHRDALRRSARTPRAAAPVPRGRGVHAGDYPARKTCRPCQSSASRLGWRRASFGSVASG